ncbi:MAG TPA: aldo/keto reductase, partial [Planctomycetes bacterium]|nr:aldo/keto reductase [Planctomycetota bacterium]
MRTNKLGRTGIQVSEFCVGLLPIGPLQLNVPPDTAADVIRHALEGGVTFFDTARSYRTESYLQKGLGRHSSDAVIATKSPARDEDGMAQDVETSLKELGRDHIEIYHIHAARDKDPFANRAGALKRLLKLKDEGVIRAVGVATHFVNVVEAAAGRGDVDVVLAINNLTGMGVMGGGREEMSAAMK